jgi:hypothetical protein
MMDDGTVTAITTAIKDIAKHGAEWAGDYHYDAHSNEFRRRNDASNTFVADDVFAI